MRKNINKIVNEELNKHLLKEYYNNQNVFNEINNAISFIENKIPLMSQEIRNGQEQGRMDLSLNEFTYKNFIESIKSLRMNFNKFARN